MSTTTIKSIWPGKRHENLEVLRNSHGGAPVVWGALYAHYVDGSGPYPESNYMYDTKVLCSLSKCMSIPKHQRAMLTMTYDNAYVSKPNYKRAAADIRAWLQDFPPKDGYANHWQRIAEVFEADPDIPAIGFYWTSVGDDPFRGSWNEKINDYDQPEWSIYWEVYKQLDALDV